MLFRGLRALAIVAALLVGGSACSAEAKASSDLRLAIEPTKSQVIAISEKVDLVGRQAVNAKGDQATSDKLTAALGHLKTEMDTLEDAAGTLRIDIEKATTALAEVRLAIIDMRNIADTIHKAHASNNEVTGPVSQLLEKIAELEKTLKDVEGKIPS